VWRNSGLAGGRRVGDELPDPFSLTRSVVRQPRFTERKNGAVGDPGGCRRAPEAAA